MTGHVMLTGGMGFIGHHLAKLYIDEGIRVTIVDNLSAASQQPRLVKYRMEQLDSKKVHFIHSSCSMSFSIKDKIKFGAPQSVIHLASYANQAAVDSAGIGAVSSMNSDTFATINLAKHYNAKYIYVSSSMVYGNFTQNPQSETAELTPTNMYGLLKKHSEEITRLLESPYVIVRPSAVYGPGDSAERVLGKWIRSAIRDEPIIINDPSSMLDFTYVKDTAQGIMLAEQRGIIGRAYNITRGQSRSLGEAAHIIKDKINSRSEIRYGRRLEGDPVRGALDIALARNDLGYKPRYDLQDGLDDYIMWMQTWPQDND